MRKSRKAVRFQSGASLGGGAAWKTGTTPATLPAGFTEVPVATGLSNATAMEFDPNGDLWVLQQSGIVKRFRPGSTAADVAFGTLANVGLRSEGSARTAGHRVRRRLRDRNKRVYLYYTRAPSGRTPTTG